MGPLDVFSPLTRSWFENTFEAWLERMRALPGFVDDLVPYPANARPGASRSIYDS